MSSPDEFKSSPRYDRIVAASRQIAWDLGHSYVGVEHLFLAIVQDPDAVPTQVLSRLSRWRRLVMPSVTSSPRRVGGGRRSDAR